MNEHLVNNFEESLQELVKVFSSKGNDYFFTEKELHSYFYHICINHGFMHKDYSLIHTEYPTPFKCRTLDSEPYIERVDKNDKNQRAHIDLVLLNPNFIDYVFENKAIDQFRYISGIGGELFSRYIDDFYNIYEKFCNAYKESILLYALEFKFQRHSYAGEKYPSRNLKQDIQKLKLLNEPLVNNTIPFCQKIKSVVFIGERISPVSRNSLIGIAQESNGVCKVYEKTKK